LPLPVHAGRFEFFVEGLERVFAHLRGLRQ
jgi:hypothetical protein